jgi:RNA polymerase sigma factor (TIGR02999 family)
LETRPGQITLLLDAADGGDTDAVQALWAAVNDEVRGMAAARLRHEQAGGTLQPTLLVNEVFLRMCPKESEHPQWQNRAHFFGSIGRAMSQFLIDHARSRGRLKRGGDHKRMPLKVSTGELAATAQFDALDLAAAGEAFKLLQSQYPRPASVAYLRWMQGNTIDQVAAALDIAPSTVSDDWKFAQAWLRRAVQGDVAV